MTDRREYHAHIFDGFQDGSLGVCLLFDTRREWTKAKKDLLAEGFRLHIIGMIRGTVCAPAEENAVLLLLDCEAALAIIKKARGVESEYGEASINRCNAAMHRLKGSRRNISAPIMIILDGGRPGGKTLRFSALFQSASRTLGLGRRVARAR